MFWLFINLCPGNGKAFKGILCHSIQSVKTGIDRTLHWYFFFLLALQPPLGVVFYSPLVGFSLLAYEVS